MKKIIRIILITSILSIFTSCTQFGSLESSNLNELPIEDVTQETINENAISDENYVKAIKFITDFQYATNEMDKKLLYKLIDEHGFYSIVYFSDGRESPSVVFNNYSNIRDDFILSGEGVSFGGIISLEGFLDLDQGKVEINDSKELSNINLELHWYDKDQKAVKEDLNNIIEACIDIIQTNNKFIQQISFVKDKYYAYSESSLTFTTHLEIVGRWIIFEKTNDGFKLRAIIDMQ